MEGHRIKRVVGVKARLLLLILAALAVLPGASGAASDPRQAVDVSLLADVAVIQPGVPFKLAVLFKIAKPWHVYWKYPGAAGLPTRISWEMPKGFKAGSILWPIAGVFNQPGNVPGYGYEDEVLLAVQVVPSELLEFSKDLPFQAEVRWLACSDICVPGRAKLQLNLPVGSEAQLSNQELFSAWEKRLANSAQEYILDASDAWVLAAGSRRVSLEANFPTPTEILRWLPAPGPGLIIEDVEFQKRLNGARLSFTATVGELADQREQELSLSYLLVLSQTAGDEEGLEGQVIIPIR